MLILDSQTEKRINKESFQHPLGKTVYLAMDGPFNKIPHKGAVEINDATAVKFLQDKKMLYRTAKGGSYFPTPAFLSLGDLVSGTEYSMEKIEQKLPSLVAGQSPMVYMDNTREVLIGNVRDLLKLLATNTKGAHDNGVIWKNPSAQVRTEINLAPKLIDRKIVLRNKTIQDGVFSFKSPMIIPEDVQQKGKEQAWAVGKIADADLLTVTLLYDPIEQKFQVIDASTRFNGDYEAVNKVIAEYAKR